MKILLLCLLLVILPARAAMDITRELIAPSSLVPGQPLRVAVTFWTDSWFNPPPSWPVFSVENGALLPTNLPNQLVSRQVAGVSWSGIRMEREVMAWDQGMLRFPALTLTLESSGQPPKTVSLPALEKAVQWPADVQQPDRFLPASALTVKQKITLYQASQDNGLHVGDVIEREVTILAEGVIAAQIPPLLFDLPGPTTQRLTPVTQTLTQGRGEITGSQRSEKLRYLPDTAGQLTLPPIKLRWWDTQQQQWRIATLPGKQFDIQAARQAGSEQILRARSHWPLWQSALALISGALILIILWFTRHWLWRGLKFAWRAWHRWWQVTPLPLLYPQNRAKR